MAKAKEALERKKRMAEKTQARAEFKVRKEAEQKEKEREKRAKKKGKRRGSTSEIGETEPTLSAESASNTSREPEANDTGKKVYQGFTIHKTNESNKIDSSSSGA